MHRASVLLVIPVVVVTATAPTFAVFFIFLFHLFFDDACVCVLANGNDEHHALAAAARCAVEHVWNVPGLREPGRGESRRRAVPVGQS